LYLEKIVPRRPSYNNSFSALVLGAGCNPVRCRRRRRLVLVAPNNPTELPIAEPPLLVDKVGNERESG
jgi:hypothetical protein